MGRTQLNASCLTVAAASPHLCSREIYAHEMWACDGETLYEAVGSLRNARVSRMPSRSGVTCLASSSRALRLPSSSPHVDAMLASQHRTCGGTGGVIPQACDGPRPKFRLDAL